MYVKIANNFQIFLTLVLKVYVNSTGLFDVGEMISLTCFITRVHNISGDINILWTGPDGNLVDNINSVLLGTLQESGSVTSLSLQFSPLHTSHGGLYTCEATFTSQNIMYTVSALHEVIITGNIL